MKNVKSKFIICAIVILCVVLAVASTACATLCDIGGMSVDGYAHYIGMLGIVCGLLFCIGINQ